jgi:ankyrin repeat protein
MGARTRVLNALRTGPTLALNLEVQVTLLLVVAFVSQGCGDFMTAIGRPPDNIYRAAGRGDVKAVKKFLDDGHDVNRVTKYGQFVLLQAVSNHRPAVVRLLLSRGASANRPSKGIKVPLCVALQRRFYGQDRRIEISRLLLDSGANPNVVCKRSKGDTPLTFSIRAADKEVLELLLRRGASPDVRNRSGERPLQVAATHCRSHCLPRLLVAGADPRVLTWSQVMRAEADAVDLFSRFQAALGGKHNPTPEDMAKAARSLVLYLDERVRSRLDRPNQPLALVLAKRDVNARDSDGKTAIEAAWRAHQPATVVLLLANGGRGARTEILKIRADLRSIEGRPRAQIKRVIESDPILVKALAPAPVNCRTDECRQRQRSRKLLHDMQDLELGSPKLSRAASFYVMSRRITLGLLEKHIASGEDPAQLRKQLRR